MCTIWLPKKRKKGKEQFYTPLIHLLPCKKGEDLNLGGRGRRTERERENNERLHDDGDDHDRQSYQKVALIVTEIVFE